MQWSKISPREMLLRIRAESKIILKKKNLKNLKTIRKTLFTLKAFGIVAVTRSSIKPPDNVPTIPQMIVTAPKIISAFFCQDTVSWIFHEIPKMNLIWNKGKSFDEWLFYHFINIITRLWSPIWVCSYNKIVWYITCLRQVHVSINEEDKIV